MGRAGVSESFGSARNEPGQGYARETRCCGYHAGRRAVRCRRKSCICRWLRRSGRGQERGRKVLRQGRQPDVQSAERRDGGLVHLFGIPPYHADCHVCHGPDAEGSRYAPALSHVLKTMNYPDFANVVVNGRKNVNTAQESVMPSFGTNPNVMCYIEDIFVYLRARANDALPRGRPQKHEDKLEAVTQAENSCLGHRS